MRSLRKGRAEKAEKGDDEDEDEDEDEDPKNGEGNRRWPPTGTCEQLQ